MSYADMPTGSSSGSNKTLMLALLALIVIVASLRWFGGDGESAPGAGGGDSGGATGRLLVLNGRASLLREEGPPAPDVPAGDTAVVEVGDRIRTAEGSAARLTFGSASTVEVGADAEVTMLDLRGGLLSRGPVISLALLRGGIRVRLEDMPLRTGELLLETSILSLASRASHLECSLNGADRVHVAVHTGEATVSMGEQSVRVAAGQILDAALGQTLSPITVATLAGPATVTPSGGVPSFLDESNQTLFPPIVTPTRPGDPAPVGTRPPEAVSGADTYVVQAGDTLYSIARRFGVSWEAVWEANRDALPAPELIREGQTLRIPR